MTDLIDKWKELNHDLHQALQQIDVELTPKDTQDVFLILFSGFIHKATKTLYAINLLYENNLPEEAQAIIRILFELRITFCCFLTMKFNDPKAGYERILDSMILEKAKQARASNFGGMTEDEKKNILSAEQAASQKYSPEELKNLKKNGFTGMNIEERAKLCGEQDDYNVAYRNFSRNVHSTDYLERFISHKDLRREDHDEYISSRDIYSLSLAFISANEIARNANNFYKLNFNAKLEQLTKRKHAINQPS